MDLILAIVALSIGPTGPGRLRFAYSANASLVDPAAST